MIFNPSLLVVINWLFLDRFLKWLKYTGFTMSFFFYERFILKSLPFGKDPAGWQDGRKWPVFDKYPKRFFQVKRNFWDTCQKLVIFCHLVILVIGPYVGFNEDKEQTLNTRGTTSYFILFYSLFDLYPILLVKNIWVSYLLHMLLYLKLKIIFLFKSDKHTI
jgi:hypothetical protein